MVVPAGTSAALVISTPSILRPARAAQGSADSDWAAKGAHNTEASRTESLQCVMISLLSREANVSAARTILCEVRRRRRLLDGCLDFLALVAYFSVRRAGHVSADAAPVRNQDDAKPAIFDDPRKGSFPSADCQHAGVIVPANGNHSVLAFLILVCRRPHLHRDRICHRLHDKCEARWARRDPARRTRFGDPSRRWNPRARKGAYVQEVHPPRCPGRR